MQENTSQKNYEQEEAYIRAKKQVERITGFYWHLVTYILVNLFIIFIIARNLDANESFWSLKVFSTPLFWGIGLAVHFFNVFMPNFLFGKAWEQRQIKKYMEKEKNQWE